MKRADDGALLTLLSSMGYQYTHIDGEAHLTMRAGELRWNMVLRMTDEAVWICSRLPCEVHSQAEALQYCNSANLGLLEGALLLDGNRVLARTAAWRTDDFYLREQLWGAMERNAAIVLKHLAGLRRAAGPRIRAKNRIAPVE